MNVIIDYGLGNLNSVQKGFERVGLETKISSNIDDIKKRKNILGICLGMQLLYEKSFENGEYDGLGLIEGHIKKFDVNLKVPHMGWNDLKIQKKDPIVKYIKEGDYVYYVHSYYAEGKEENLV